MQSHDKHNNEKILRHKNTPMKNKRNKCKAKTKAGKRCKKEAIISGYCAIHLPNKEEREPKEETKK